MLLYELLSIYFFNTSSVGSKKMLTCKFIFLTALPFLRENFKLHLISYIYVLKPYQSDLKHQGASISNMANVTICLNCHDMEILRLYMCVECSKIIVCLEVNSTCLQTVAYSE